MSKAKRAVQAIDTVVLTFISAGLTVVVACRCLVAADDLTNRVISFDRKVLEFTPNRADLTVGIVWLSVLTPDEDWTVSLQQTERINFQDTGSHKYVELKQIEHNRFELPPLKIEAIKRESGPVCVSLKVWFNEILNEFDSLYWIDTADRYSLLTFCTGDDKTAQARHSQNRVRTLREFRTVLDRPFALRLRRDLAPLRPSIFVDDQGAVYFHSLLVGQHTPGMLSHHLMEAWMLSPDRQLKRLPIPDFTSRPPWPDRVSDLADEPFGTLLRIALTEVITRDAVGNLYSPSVTSGPPGLNQLVRIDAKGRSHTIAGSTAGHKDGTARQAQFYNITALTTRPGGYVYVADGDLNAGSWIRCVAPDGTVTTLAGSEALGLAGGKHNGAQFFLPSGLAADDSGNVYAADPVYSRVRKITPDGVVTTVAEKPGDPSRAEAFVKPSGVALGPNGGLYVLDGGSQMARVSMIHPDGRKETLVVVDASVSKKIPR